MIWLGIVIVLLILITLAWFRIGASNAHENMFQGYWEADDDFLTSTKLTGLFITIGPARKKWFWGNETRPAHLIMTGSQTVIFNGTIWLEFRSGQVRLHDTDPLLKDQKLSPDDLPITEIMTSDWMDFVFKPELGCMICEDGEHQYARFFRNFAADADLPTEENSEGQSDGEEV